MVDVDATALFLVNLDQTALFQPFGGRRSSTSILQPFSSRPFRGPLLCERALLKKKMHILYFQKFFVFLMGSLFHSLL